jgi:hypothetical protein
VDLAHVHPIGLLLGAEEDWPHAFEAILRRVGPVVTTDGVTHTFTSERLTIEPFDLTDPVRYELVIDRLAHWYYHPREWLKKAALVNGTYLLNSPFTFQSMEKHSAYCAMLRLGLKVPRTVLVPYKNPVDNDRWAPTSAKYNLPFDLSAIAADLGYPLYMKPFDGGGWRGVSRIENEDELHSAYNESGEMLMHLQATVPHEKFARALSIGPETMVHGLPRGEAHAQQVCRVPRLPLAHRGRAGRRHQPGRQRLLRLGVQLGRDARAGRRGLPHRLRQRLPRRRGDLPALLLPLGDQGAGAWSVYCLVTGRPAKVDLQTERYFAIADDPSLDDDGKLAAYLKIADEHFETERYWEWCATHLPHLDEQVLDWVTSTDFDRMLKDTVRATYPEHEATEFLDHFHGLVDLWVIDEGARMRAD